MSHTHSTLHQQSRTISQQKLYTSRPEPITWSNPRSVYSQLKIWRVPEPMLSTNLSNLHTLYIDNLESSHNRNFTHPTQNRLHWSSPRSVYSQSKIWSDPESMISTCLSNLGVNTRRVSADIIYKYVCSLVWVYAWDIPKSRVDTQQTKTSTQQKVSRQPENQHTAKNKKLCSSPRTNAQQKTLQQPETITQQKTLQQPETVTQ